MSIESAPLQSPNPAYRPLQWIFKATSVNVVERCIPVITINGTDYTMPPVPFSSNIGNDYYFKVDAQTFVQNALAPKSTAKSSIFGDFNLPYVALNADCFATISISVTYLYRNPATNILTDLGVTDADGDWYAIPSTPQNGEDLDYENYKPQFLATSRKFLSILPSPAKIALTENAWLTFLADAGANQIRITSYTTNGTQINTGTFAVSISSINEPQTIGVGAANLATQVYTSGSVDLSDPTTAYYTVELIGAASPFLQPYLETKRFNLSQSCGNTTARLHWFGILNGAESYTFTANIIKRLQVTNNYATKSLNWGETLPQNDVSDKGAFKISADGSQLYELQSDILTQSESEWLKTLLTSPEVYIETSAGLMAAVIETAEQEVMNSNGDMQLTVTARLSNNIISQIS